MCLCSPPIHMAPGSTRLPSSTGKSFHLRGRLCTLASSARQGRPAPPGAQEPPAPASSAEARLSSRRHMLLQQPVLMLCCSCCSVVSALPTAADAVSGLAFSYGDLSGPEHWGGMCRTGRNQSPIDLPAAAPSNRNRDNNSSSDRADWFIRQPSNAASSSSDAGGSSNSDNPSSTTSMASMQLRFSYQSDLDVRILNTGFGTMQVNIPPGSHLSVDGTTYELLQFHFHAPSEHAFAGRHAPMEAHLVHRSASTGALAVVAVLLQPADVQPPLHLSQPRSMDDGLRIGSSNAHTAASGYDCSAADGPAACTGARQGNNALRVSLQHAPRQPRVEGACPERLSPAQLLPPADVGPGIWSCVRYRGSLTTPPCSEGVEWLVLQPPLPITSSQVLDFMHYMGGGVSYTTNARPLQALHGRQIRYDCLQSLAT